MAVSEEVIIKLEELKKNIQKFLKLHKNPYDSSVHNELAAKLERIESILSSINHGDKVATNDEAFGKKVDNSCMGDMGSDKNNTVSNKGAGMSSQGKTDSDNKDADMSGQNNTSSNKDADMSGQNNTSSNKDAGMGGNDDSSKTSSLAKSISKSVGNKGANVQADVDTVRGWLNKHGAGLETTGPSDNKLINAIKKFQRRLGNSRPDGRVDPGKGTWKGLIGEAPVGPPVTGVSSLIQGGESGAAGYNAYNRGTFKNTMRGSNGPRKLVEMTLATIINNQGKPKTHPDYLFAVGKYQMIPITLADGIDKLKLDKSLKYDMKTQELLFSGYLMDKKRSDISDYVKERSGNSARAAGIAGAMEWASIACPANTIATREDKKTKKKYKVDVSGKSYYDGVGGNSSHITHSEFIAVLDEAKEAYRKNISKGMSDTDAYHAAVSGMEKTANSGGSDNSGSGSDKDAGMGGNGNTGSDKDAGMGGNGNTGSDKDAGMGGNSTPKSNNQSITASVGAGGVNNKADVKIVQGLLNAKGAKLTVDGKNGKKTEAAIRSFQKSLGQSNPDGRVDPGKNTWKGLIGSGGSVNPTGTGTGNPSFDPGKPLAAGAKPSSSNFNYNEFISPRDPVRNVPTKYWANLQKLMNNLEVIRKALGVSMTINSGYRSPGYNAKIGGASRSQHMLAKAADIRTSLPPSKVHATITRLINEGKITPGGVGRYKNFTHYDVRGSFTPFNGAY